MDIVNLKFVADTKDLDEATKKLEKVGSTTEDVAKKATKSTGALGDSLGKFKDLPGPIGEVAGKLLNVGETAKVAYDIFKVNNAVTATTGAITGTTTTAIVGMGTALGSTAAATAQQVAANLGLIQSQQAVLASTLIISEATRDHKDRVNTLRREIYKLVKDNGGTVDMARQLSSAAGGAVHQLAKASDEAARAQSKLGASVKEVTTAAEVATPKVSSLSNAVRALATPAGLAATVALLAGAGGIIAGLNFAGPLDDLGDLAEKLGLSATQALLLRQQMEGAGLSTETYQQGLQRASVSLSKAGEDGKAASEALERLNVAVTDSTTPQQLLNTLTAEYQQKLKEGSITATEAAALQTVLGKNYRETMLAVGEYNKAQERANEYQALGIGISKDGVQAAGDLEKANNDMAFILGVVGSKLVGEVVPAFTGFINALVDSYKNGGLVKVAFDGIRIAAQVLMVPIRALFNIFIQLDAAVQSVGKSIGALFAAMATRSLDPFKSLKEDLARIWETANSRTTGLYAEDSGKVAAPGSGVVTPATTTPGTKKDKTKEELKLAGDAIGPWKEWLAIKEAIAKRDLEDLARYEEREAAAQTEYESLMRRTQGYKDLADPAATFRRELELLIKDYETGLVPIEAFTAKQLQLEDAIKKATETTKEQSLNMLLVQRIGESAFKGIEDALVSFTTTGKLNFGSFVASVLQDISRLIIQLTVIKPLMDGLTASMKGGSFIDAFMGSITASAKGNVFDGKGLMHGFNGGIGTLGEKGPEGVLPLKRTSSGQLGVIASGGGGGVQVGQITVNVQGGSTNGDTGQVVSKAVVDAMKQVARGEIASSRRPGGLLYPA